MSHLQTFQILPAIPEQLSFLNKLARNLWWCWCPEAIQLFQRIDPGLWHASERNPLKFLVTVSSERLDQLAADQGFIAHMASVEKRFIDETEKASPLQDGFYRPEETIAYFSMEYGLHESIPLFAGGLGVLAGDHLKAASDEGLPLVYIGLLYRQGYFRQSLDMDGSQIETFSDTDLFYMPLKRIRDRAGNELHISINGPDGKITAIAWKMSIGRASLYLLDTNLPQNSSTVRDITARLYTADGRQRLAQEVLLGIGGMRVLDALGIVPAVCHLNEGHPAFASFERIAQTMTRHQIDLKTAREIVSRTTVFTTHTPLPAGHDEFGIDLVKPYLASFEKTLGVSTTAMLSWGQHDGAGPEAPFSMFVLGLHMSQYHNGVSALHGHVARKMWAHVWPEWPKEEVPIGHVTNGVHVPSWLSIENAVIFERYLGPEWSLNCSDETLVAHIADIFDEELWRAHQMSRSRLVRVCRNRLVDQYSRLNASAAALKELETVLGPEILTIGFARRFATYKRATLLLQDPQRFERLLLNEKYPVQFIFAGKAHPQDNDGKNIIKNLVEFARQPKLRHRIIFLQDYDINITRNMVQGCDVWLNTPRRPLEASGTSGIKAAANGTLNLSILDGWWDEGFRPESGWAIGRGEEYSDHAYQDAVESQALYNLLENDVIPCFYERKNGEAPVTWIKMMKASMQTALQKFCAHRMVHEYDTRYYRPAVTQQREMTADQCIRAHQLVDRRNRLKKDWAGVVVDPPQKTADGPFEVGQSLEITTRVKLGSIKPEDVQVELYHGRFKDLENVQNGTYLPMTLRQSDGNGEYLYGCTLPCEAAGRFAFTARVVPHGDDRLRYTPGLITWA